MSEDNRLPKGTQPSLLEDQNQSNVEECSVGMAASLSQTKSRFPRGVKIVPYLYKVLLGILYRVPAAILVSMIIVFLWSSATTLISSNIFHICFSWRKPNNLYCLSPGGRPDFEFPVPMINNGSADVAGDDHPDPVAIASKNGIDKKIAIAVKDIENQLQVQRSWASDENHTACDGRGVYVYDLPSKFNKDLVGQCGDMIPWTKLCRFFKNEGKGERISELGEGWYHTHQYSLEPIFHGRVLKHPCRVYDEKEAKLFYVPFYGGLDILRWNFKNVSNDVKDALPLELMKWLENKTSWLRNSGKDHVFVLGKISWDFRRRDDSPWGSRFLNLGQMQNPIKLLIERQPWHVNDIGIPHPTFFHPHSDKDIIAWQLKIMETKRKSLVGFAGGARPNAPENIRSVLINQCTSVDNQKCKFLNCGTGGCNQPESIIHLFMKSEFCLQPPGDSPTRKSVFDSLISGCIPVLFDPFTAYYQYPWHLPEDHGKYSAFIDQEEVRQMKVNVVERLTKVPPRIREEMRRYIAFELMPSLVYGDSDSRLEKFKDAFSIAINNLLHRVNQIGLNPRT